MINVLNLFVLLATIMLSLILLWASSLELRDKSEIKVETRNNGIRFCRGTSKGKVAFKGREEAVEAQVGASLHSVASKKKNCACSYGYEPHGEEKAFPSVFEGEVSEKAVLQIYAILQSDCYASNEKEYGGKVLVRFEVQDF